MDKFTTKLQLLNVNKWWEELCPSEHIWHFVSRDKRYAATVDWRQRIVTFSRNKV